MSLFRKGLAIAGAVIMPAVAFAQSNAEAAADKELVKARMKGAAQQDLDAFLANRDPAVRPFYQALFVEGERNAVLNFDRIGLIELERHNPKQAALMLDQAADRIDAIYANDPNAEKARSLWSAESVKDFKGEPYERAMTYYYRGLARLMMNDFENARANFKRAEEQTLLSESETYQKSSFAALTYLSGWASHCAGDERGAKEYFDTAIARNDQLRIPSATDSVLLVGEIGKGPTKSSQGKYHEELKMIASSNVGDSASFLIEGEPAAIVAVPSSGRKGAAQVLPAAPGPVTVTGVLASNISEQSMMRDGRPVDTILKGKAKFKDGAATAGQVGVAAGAGLMQAGIASNNSSMANMGAGFALFGVIATIAAEAATPAADIRYWDSLPNELELGSSKFPANNPHVKWTGGSVAGSEMYVTQGPVCSIAWGRDSSALTTNASAPNAAPGPRADSKRLAHDAEFRAMLLTNFSAPAAATPEQPGPIPVSAGGAQ